MTKRSHRRCLPTNSRAKSRTTSRTDSERFSSHKWLLTAFATGTLALSACADGYYDDYYEEDQSRDEINSTRQSIINGDAITETTPFVFLDNGCSGTLINADTVLTATHCISDGTTTTGKSRDLDFYSGSRTFFGVSDHTANDIVGAAIASDDHVYYWYDDYEVSSGTSTRLTEYRSTYTYSLQADKTPNNIVGIAIDSSDLVWVWYDDYTLNVGSTGNLNGLAGPLTYSLPADKSPNDIVAMAIAPGDTRVVYAWFVNGNTLTVSSGNPLDFYQNPASYTIAPGRSANEIVGIGIAKSNSRVYTWYNDGGKSNNPPSITIQSGGQSATATEVIRHPDLDVAIVRSVTNFPRPNDIEGGFSWPAMFASAVPGLLDGRSVDCYGYGRNTFDGGTGTLRRGDDLNVSNSQQGVFRTYPNPTDKEVQWKGDSGSGCFLRNQVGNLMQVGVENSCVFDGTKKQVLYCNNVPVGEIGPWISDND